ncbi:MAG: Fe-S protein assembly chaperone HscA [Candidatus Berkiella sp.]
MSFLEITTPEKAKPRLAVGIDLGTTHSLIACDINGQVQIFGEAEGQALVPSAVHYSSVAVQVGSDAKALYASDPQNTLLSIKRLMGKNRSDLQAWAALPYQFADSPFLQIKTAMGDFSPVEVSADILKALLKRAQAFDGTIEEAVITVPAYFDEAGRQATKDAARLAGIRLLRLLNEPTAAAIAYGLDQGTQGYCLVYDFGGGTFDVSLLKLTKGVFEVLATGGDTHLGGDDIDQLIAHWIIEQAKVPASFFPEALTVARVTKEALSTKESIQVALSTGWVNTLTRVQVEEWIAPLLERTLAICGQVLKDAKLQVNEIDHVVLVGGATRMPLLQRRVGDFFGKEPLCSIDPDKVVAMGAAMQASLLAGNRRDSSMLLLDVIPLSLGIEMMGGVVEKLLWRNTPVPALAKQIFTTYQDNQTGLSLHVVQGERDLAQDCRSLATFDISLPPMPKGKARVEVVLRVDADGLLQVEATELSSGTQRQITIKPSYGLTQEMVSSMIETAIDAIDEDKQARKCQEKINEATLLMIDLEKALAQDSGLLSVNTHQNLLKHIEALRLAMSARNSEAIKKALKDMQPSLQTFAELRLNAALKQVVSGKRVNELDTLLS